jgi:hypothetical protein
MKAFIGNLGLYFSLLLMLVSFSFLMLMAHPFLTEYRWKEYVIKHKADFHKTEHGLKTDSTAYSYYTDVTLKLLEGSDSTYQLIFWGNRDSKLWDFKLDKLIIVDIPYNRSKGKDVTVDNEIIEFINSFK